MSYKDKILHPLRFYPDEYKKIKHLADEDGISFQKLGEVLFRSYVRGHKPTKRLVEKYVENHKGRKKRTHLGEMEAAQSVEDAVAAVIAEGQNVTYDLKPSRDDPTAVGTSEMADAFIEAMH